MLVLVCEFVAFHRQSKSPADRFQKPDRIRQQLQDVLTPSFASRGRTARGTVRGEFMAVAQDHPASL